nr:hypothetical protein [Desulfobacterales bacterium]
MATEKIVIDASVVAKWFLEEVYGDKAVLLRDKYVGREIQLASPSIMPYEVLNARLVTADEEIVTKAKNLIDVKHVKDLI